ncbi:efflux pump antibiotic resistance protein, putative [Talaromyces stipitatus ATCC 10500]|uniref:Efflux pump antibiotic resistance protein, putative n=1 Tax=Talaromyces stipitatus (strain ATCC 10500 / CBS 375.48 / QM 6759 / NRRL 1006) TaxID=441959 RepID=B8M0K6_TALSN|nr:efflux pump antibiotic resistance protein, putative [Talaromyces stipitatus ATCC 10500]EED21303.1 efflux pump antibiotic resistance protein, putative [Talaromyces stipitatus ATCC 10500]
MTASPETTSVSSSTTNVPQTTGDPQDLDLAEKNIEENKSSQSDESADEIRSIQGWRWLAIPPSRRIFSLMWSRRLALFEKLAWLGTGFSLGSIAIIMCVGKAFGIFNLRVLHISSLVMFEAGSALCGGAPNMNALICGRIWAGMGGAGMYLGGLNTMAIFTTKAEKAVYIGLIALFWGVGCILGPIIGGAFADSGATWRWAFYINLVIFGALAPAYYFTPSFDPQPTKSIGKKLRDVDWVGTVLNATVYVTFVMALTFGGATWRWGAGGTIGMFVAFGVSLIAFSIQQTFSIFTTEENRIFPIDFLRRPVLILLYVLTACSATGLFLALYYIPVYFQFAHGENGITSAVRLLPFVILFVFFVMVNSFVMSKTGWYMPWFVFSGIFITIGAALMYALVNSNTSNSAIYGYSVILALGVGSTCQAAYSIASAKVDPHRTSDAVGFINSAQIGSITISLSISGTIFQNIAYQNIQAATEGLGFTPADIHAAIAGAKSVIFDDTTAEVRAVVVEGIVNAIDDVYIMAIAAGAFATVAAFLLPRERLYIEMAAGG